jgi:hypothetical protein
MAEWLATWRPPQPVPNAIQLGILDALVSVIELEWLWDKAAFAHLPVDPVVYEMLNVKGVGPDWHPGSDYGPDADCAVARLNRHLIEAAFDGAIARRETVRPSWRLTSTNLVPRDVCGPHPRVWHPTPDHVLEDGLLMIGAFVEKDPDLLAALRAILGDRLDSDVDLTAIPRQELEGLRTRNRAAANQSRLVITVLSESSLADVGALRALSLYRYGYSICPWHESRHGGICVVRGEGWGTSDEG